MPKNRITFRVHAIRRMFERSITEGDVRHVLDTGDVIERYPDDKPYPSRLVLGFCGGRPVHIVAADNGDELQTIVVTVYEPDAKTWEDDFRRRRK